MSERSAGKASIIESTRVALGPFTALREHPARADVLAKFPEIRQLPADILVIIRLLLWHRLDFSMQHQQQTNWCWAAVATSVALFCNAASTWTQCLVANGELNRSDCCGAGAGGPCNVYGFLNTSLTRVGHLDHMTGGVATFQQVESEIKGGRPLCVRTAWSGGGAHFLAIIGYRIADNMLAVDDPWYGKSDVGYSAFCNQYKGSGTWTHSYYTKP